MMAAQDKRSNRVLIIDDEAGIRESMAAYLEDSGFDISEAENGRIGIEKCRVRLPDIILCDLRMPELDGLGVLAAVQEEFEETPIIIVSGQSDLQDAIQALKLGAWDYITKPVPDMAVLEHAVRLALEKASLIRENRKYRESLEEMNLKLRQAVDHMHADQEAARKIQFQLLPEDNTEYNSCLFSRRLFTSASLSGDFVDYFRINSTNLGFYFADVAGHGVPSALVTVILKNSMTRYLEDFWQNKSDIILDPVGILDQLNYSLLGAGLQKHVAIFYGIINAENNTLQYSNGGHYPYPILFNGHEGKYLEGCKSLPVGLFSHAEYKLVEQSLPDQFVMLLSSDGVWELLPEENLKDNEGKLLSMVNSSGLSMADLEAEFKLGDPAKELPDDVTFLLIKRPA